MDGYAAGITCVPSTIRKYYLSVPNLGNVIGLDTIYSIQVEAEYFLKNLGLMVLFLLYNTGGGVEEDMEEDSKTLLKKAEILFGLNQYTNIKCRTIKTEGSYGMSIISMMHVCICFSSNFCGYVPSPSFLVFL